MLPNRRWSIHLFRFAGIDVFLHWSWFLGAILLVRYGVFFSLGDLSLPWRAAEYLSLFVIVLLHEFGHSLACKSVGGRADQIVLWPLGGVAFVDPPPRPGATLWSIAAGPLVNVLLIPIFGVLWLLAHSQQWDAVYPNLNDLIESVWWLNLGLLGFNLLPIYPLDGGQILRSILWYFLGQVRSLLVASSIGMAAVVLLLIFAIRTEWLAIMAVFVIAICWQGLQQARLMGRVAAAPRRLGYACPKCKKAPPTGNFWICGRCRTGFDMFGARGVCPKCGTIYNISRCLECGEIAPISSFVETAPSTF